MPKPSVFVGSSTEGLEFARAVRALLDQDAEVTLWKEGFFGPTGTFIETLVTSLPRFDFAVLLLTADDWIRSRQEETFGPRDNVIFELGLFMGHLGRTRTFVLHQTNAGVKVPSDLAGVTMATYEWPRADRNHQAAVGAACDAIRRVIADLGISEAKAGKQISEITSRQETIESSIQTLQVVVKGILTRFEYEKLLGLEADGPFKVRYHQDMYPELKRLDAIGYVQPQKGQKLVALREERSGEFDLKDYVRITHDGREFLKMRRELLERQGADAPRPGATR
jgi:hypothetical protein